MNDKSIKSIKMYDCLSSAHQVVQAEQNSSNVVLLTVTVTSNLRLDSGCCHTEQAN